MALQFYTSVTEGAKVKSQKVSWLICKFAEVTGGKAGKETFLPLLPPILNRVKDFFGSTIKSQEYILQIHLMKNFILAFPVPSFYLVVR